MDFNGAKSFMKDYFERLYKKLSEKAPVALQMPDLPEEMLADGADPDEEWNTWKLIPSTVTDEDIAEYEKESELNFPNCIRAFLQTYHHFFDFIGRNMPDEPFEAIDNAFNPHLAANGYFPFAWDEDGYFIRCFDLANMPDEEKCPVVQFDHEVLFDMQYEYEDNDEEIPRNKLEGLADRIADIFYDFLDRVFDGSINGE